MTSHQLPMELIDKCVGSKIHLVLKGNKEILGTLTGFDTFMNMVLTDVVEWYRTLPMDVRQPSPKHIDRLCPRRREITPEGRRETKLDQILLNGNNIAILVPGGLVTAA